MINHIEPYYGEAERKAIQEYLNSGGYMTEHTYTQKLEEMLAEFLEVKYVSLVPNGTVALYLALLASGIGQGDEVIVPDLTMIATINAVRMIGAVPVLVDVDMDMCLNISKIRKTDKTKAVIYVDLNGRSGNMRMIRRFCTTRNLILIEDACQAFGSRNSGAYLGTFGRFGCFSLGFHKIITTGQGGFIVSKTRRDYEAIERLKDFGRLKGGNDIHDYMGFNFKFTDLQAVIGIEQLKTIKWRMDKKRQLYKWYWGKEVDKEYIPWFIDFMSNNNDKLYWKFKNAGIETRKMYPAIHTQKIYKQDGRFPNSIDFAKRILWLPSSLNMTEEQVNKVKEQLYA